MKTEADRARHELAVRLTDRREEIAQVLLTRVYGIDEPTDVDPEYLHGLNAAVFAGLDYALAALERGDGRPPPVPVALLGQARLAARNEVSLDIVLRRYFSGFMLFADIAAQEEEARGVLRGSELHDLLRGLNGQLDRVVDAIADEYKREAAKPAASVHQRRTERVRRLLAGEPLDLDECGYELGGWHLGLTMEGKTRDWLQALAKDLDTRLLWAAPEKGVTWAWLGSWRPVKSEEVEQAVQLSLRPEERLAVGEPARGINGWRLTHNQARAALPLAGGFNSSVVRYADVGLISCVLSDQTLTNSLRQMYVEPLAQERDEGKALRETLQAYFATGRNISSTAARLGLNRQTVRNRLRAFEEKIGVCLDECAVEAEIALKIEQHRIGRETGPGPEPSRPPEPVLG